MIGTNRATLRRLAPAFVVTIAVTLAFAAPTPPGSAPGFNFVAHEESQSDDSQLDENDDFEIGYGNNCGEKGDGFHDHGKPCHNHHSSGRDK